MLAYSIPVTERHIKASVLDITDIYCRRSSATLNYSRKRFRKKQTFYCLPVIFNGHFQLPVEKGRIKTNIRYLVFFPASEWIADLGLGKSLDETCRCSPDVVIGCTRSGAVKRESIGAAYVVLRAENTIAATNQ